MNHIFTAFLLTSAMGTAVALILLILRPLTRKVFSASWHYYMWLIVLLIMILPVRLNMPELTATKPVPQTVIVTESKLKSPEIAEQHTQKIAEETAQPTKASTVQTIREFVKEKTFWLAYIWLITAILLFAFKLINYFVFLIKVHKHSVPISCPEVKTYTNRKIRARVSNTICSPLMIGMIRPVLLLPETDITPEQLKNVLAHELTHLKRNDILYKWFVSIVKCIHWFNPVIYFVSEQINIDCEISCDLAVVKEMDEQQERGYVETILSLLTHNNSKAIPLTTGMTGNKQTLKRRFIMIKNRKSTGKTSQLISTILAIVILVSAIMTSGVLATTVFDNDSDIYFACNGEEIKFKNAPFYENNTVYLPLRELLEKIGIMNHKNSSIEWNDGRIVIRLAYDDEVAAYDDNGTENGRKTQSLNYCYAIEIGKSEIVINPKESPVSSSDNPAYTAHLSVKTVMKNAPLLKNNITYVPYEYIDRMLGLNMRGLGSDDVYGPYNIICTAGIENPVTYITPALTWPAESENISNGFGKRVHPITGEEKIHNGIDIRAAENSDVISSVSGTVTDTGFDSQMGNFVEIENSNGVSVYYGHLAVVDVKKGDLVKQKSVIGKVGKTGTATGPNLHYEIRINEKPYDPMDMFGIRNIDLSTPYKALAGFLDAFKISEFETMKLYCTEECVNNYFSLTDYPETASVFGMLRAERISDIPNNNTDSVKVTLEYVVPPVSSAVSGTQTVRFDFEKQPDGTYKISGFSNS